MKQLPYLLAIAALLTACKPASEIKTAEASLIAQPAPVAPVAQEREITGTVFIVTRAATVLKLAAVEIKVVEWDAANGHMAEARKLLNKTAIEINAERDLLNEQWEREFAAGKPVFDALDNARINAAKLPPAQRAAVVEPFRLRSVAALAPVQELLAKIKDKAAMYDQFKAWERTGETAFRQPWPGVIRSIVTGPDGTYAVSVPNDRQVVLVAKSTRHVGSTEEEYLWVVTVAPTDNGPVHLSTANLLNK